MIPSLPACDLEALALPCEGMWQEGAQILERTLARIVPAYSGDCRPPIGVVTHGEPVTSASDYLAVWWVSDADVSPANSTGFLSEVSRRWVLKLVESGMPAVLGKTSDGIQTPPLALVHAASRVAYSRAGVFRDALVGLAKSRQLVDKCTAARMVSFSTVTQGGDTLPGNFGFRAEVEYRVVI